MVVPSVQRAERFQSLSTVTIGTGDQQVRLERGSNIFVRHYLMRTPGSGPDYDGYAYYKMRVDSIRQGLRGKIWVTGFWFYSREELCAIAKTAAQRAMLSNLAPFELLLSDQKGVIELETIEGTNHLPMTTLFISTMIPNGLLMTRSITKIGFIEPLLKSVRPASTFTASTHIVFVTPFLRHNLLPRDSALVAPCGTTSIASNS
ncbi:hypothetical protein BJ165DRAFT_1535244 [Panaeolus papilionaceus]|nr:hypothetical protein BJ165DRAFT_1535244 [Panaeolus papilionaceus]